MEKHQKKHFWNFALFTRFNLIIIIHIIIFITFHGRFSSSFLLTSSTVTRSSEQQESIVSPRDKIGLNMKLTSANFVIASAL